MADEADTDQDDIGADIMAAIAESGAAPADEPALETAAPEPDNQGGEGDGRIRDEHGRFAKKTDDADPLAKPSETVEIVQQPEGAAEPAQPTTQPPHSLKATLKAKWAELSPEVQAELVRMEGVAQQAKNEWQPKGEKLNRYEALIAPHRDRLQVNGTDEFQYVQTLIAADQFLQRDPGAAFMELARIYGVDLPALVGQQGQGGRGTQNLQLPQNQADLQQHVANLVQQAVSQQSEAQASERNNADIQAFRNDPKNLYFDNVRPRMAALLKSEQATTLQDAYDQACWADPEIRALLLAEQAKPPVPQQKAQPASPQVTGAPTPGGKQARNGALNGSIEGDVAEAWEQVQGGRL